MSVRAHRLQAELGPHRTQPQLHRLVSKDCLVRCRRDDSEFRVDLIGTKNMVRLVRTSDSACRWLSFADFDRDYGLLGGAL